jgi:hypothetical protein
MNISSKVTLTNPARLVGNQNRSDHLNIHHCIKLLKEQAQQLELKKSRPGFAKGGMSTVGSLMDVPITEPMPSLTSATIKKLRTSFVNGGFVGDDLGQILYLISVLESGHLTPIEAKLLEDLYEDLRKIQGGSK